MPFRTILLTGLLILFACQLSCPVSARGQAALSVGASFPIAPEGFRDAYNPGFGMAGSFPLPLPDITIIPRLSAGFALHQFDEENAVEADGSLSTIYVGVDGQLIRPHGAVKPYVAPFLGFALFSADDFSEGETGVALGAALGAAFRIPAGLHLFIEGRIVHGFLDGDDLTWMPILAGVVFDLD